MTKKYMKVYTGRNRKKTKVVKLDRHENKILSVLIAKKALKTKNYKKVHTEIKHRKKLK